MQTWQSLEAKASMSFSSLSFSIATVLIDSKALLSLLRLTLCVAPGGVVKPDGVSTCNHQRGNV